MGCLNLRTSRVTQAVPRYPTLDHQGRAEARTLPSPEEVPRIIGKFPCAKGALGSGAPRQRVGAANAVRHEDMARTLGIRDAEILPPHELDRLGTLERGMRLWRLSASRSRVSSHHWKRANSLSRSMGLSIRAISVPCCASRTGSVFAGCYAALSALMSSTQVCAGEHGRHIACCCLPLIILCRKLPELRSAGSTVYLASMEGASVFDVRLRTPAVLVMGSEAHGVSKAIRGLESDLMSVPRLGGAESLNVAMATAALCMEFTRQRLAR